MAKKSKGSALGKVAPVVGVGALLAGAFAVNWEYGGYSSIGAFEYVEGERPAMLFHGFQKGERSSKDSETALLRDARTGASLASRAWPSGAQTLGVSATRLWVKSGGGVELYALPSLERVLDAAAILAKNPFLGATFEPSPGGAKGSRFPGKFDPATGRLLIRSGQNTYVLSPDGSALALEDAEPSKTPLWEGVPDEGPCGIRATQVERICGDPAVCFEVSKPDKYGKVEVVFHGAGEGAEAERAAFYEPEPLRSGRQPWCTDRVDDSGAVFVLHEASPQDASASLSLVRPDGGEVWRVPLSSFGEGAELDRAVRLDDGVRVYGSVRGPASPLTGDYGLIATVNMADGSVSSSVVFRR